MKIFTLLNFSLCLFTSGFGQTIPLDSLYFGQTPPSDSAVIFAPGIISKTNQLENKITFSPDGTEVYLSRQNGSRGLIYHSKYANDQWSELEEASFAKNLSAFFPNLNSDGSAIYFSTWNSDTRDSDIYKAERATAGWNEAQQLPTPINSNSSDSYYSETATGVIYFASNRPGTIVSGGGYGSDIWRLNPQANSNDQIINLGSIINSNTMDGWPCIASDESFLIFSSDRSSSIGGQDLYICFKKDNSEFTPPHNMEKCKASININTFHALSPSVTPDGKYLFFTRHSPNDANPFTSDVYWVSTSIIPHLRKIAFTPKVNRRIPNMKITTDSTLYYPIPENTFKCEYDVATLNLTASLEDDTALPLGLSFDNKTLSGKPTQSGEFNIKISATNQDTVSVSDVFKLTVEQSTTSTEEYTRNKILVYPNPSNGLIRIQTKSLITPNDTYKFIDMSGKVIQQGLVGSGIIDVSEVRKGVYLLTLLGNEELYNQKLVIE